MNDDEDQGPKPNKANIDDEFLRHPHSGAFIRNPLLEKGRSLPIPLQISEFDHNCLHDALADWHCISVSESSLRDMMSASTTPRAVGSTQDPLKTTGRTQLQRAALNRLRDLPSGYEFVVTLYKSTYVPPRIGRRRQADIRVSNGVLIDKLNIEVVDLQGVALRIDEIKEGLITAWNRANPPFAVKQADQIVRVNGRHQNSAALIEELTVGPDMLKVTVHRPPPESGSRMTEHARIATDVAAITNNGQ